MSPNKEIPGARPSQYLGLFNNINNGNSSNHTVAVELDAAQNLECSKETPSLQSPNNADKPLKKLVEEIMGDHEWLVS
ncbi:hypothetical protein RHMOL_Rhmol09G0207400 [Rhododendron molle]|uniref:Uncharacterized protein n=1 Tax=Rhododendron molle TaxID=49168 RepID=A0ACC0MHE9_RHOML|nr:hypothetical protein RHMOL_Rhmol09G0207400 [Rhododendron molle]